MVLRVKGGISRFETSGIMIRPIDLGYSLFQHTGDTEDTASSLLQFSATANFAEVATGPSSRSTINFSQWKDLQTLWVFQAPQLELRLFIDFDPMIEAAGSAFAASLVKNFCRSKVRSKSYSLFD